ncbi:MAG: tripartite tricarboxylate transporter TctB family protein [Lachnospiraceae bacterium]|jgi:hypothetical protein|nr:tripartite tricarboxylate transporter TctB family protein [Lachnospiraceae bacterium]
MGEIFFLALLLLVCGACFGMSFDFKVSALDTSGGAALWPRIVIGFLVIFLVIRIFQVIKEKSRQPFVFWELFRGPRLFLLLSMILYIAFFKYLGYIASTMLFLFVTVNGFYKIARDGFGSLRSIVIRNAAVVAFTVAVYFFFGKVVHIMLPKGTIWTIFG